MGAKETFVYTYSAPEQREIKKIRDKYLPESATKLDQLRALDESVTKRGCAVSIVHGTFFTLLFGLGMCCCMVWADKLWLPGLLIGCIGIAGIAAAYPIYSRIVKQDREQITPEILRLSEELMH